MINSNDQSRIKKNDYQMYDIKDSIVSPFSGVPFGSQASLKLERQADLVHKVALKIVLPEVSMIYKKTTVQEIKNILLSLSIVWDTGLDQNEIFTTEYLEEVLLLIQNKISELNQQKTITSQILSIMNTSDLIPQGNISLSEYVDLVYEKLFVLDQNNILYNFLIAHANDNELNQEPILNAKKINSSIFQYFFDYATKMDPTNYFDENIQFYFKLETADYSVDSSNQQLSAQYIFNTGISRSYIGQASFSELDSFKTYSYIISSESSNFNFNLQLLLKKLLDNIYFSLIKNPKKLLRVYDAASPDSNFIFYRRLKVSGLSYNTEEKWINIGNTDYQTEENFTNVFVLAPEVNETDAISHKYSDIVSSELLSMEKKTATFMNLSFYEEYFNVTTFFSRTNMLSPGNSLLDSFSTLFISELTTLFPGQVSNLGNNYCLNYIPFLMVNDIPIAIERIHSSAAFFSSLQTLLLQMKTILISELQTKFTQTTTLFEIFYNLALDYKQNIGASGDVMYQAIIRQEDNIEYNSVKYTIPKYIKKRYQEIIDSFSHISFTQTEKDSCTTIINMFVAQSLRNLQSFLNNSENQLGPIINPGGLPKLCDTISSIWSLILDTHIDSYNVFFNNILSDSTIQEIGIEMKRYVTTIKDLFYQNPLNINYWFETPTLFNPSFTFLEDEIQYVISSTQSYFTNRDLLNFSSFTLANSFYYDTNDNIVEEYIDNGVEVLTHIVDGLPRLLYFHQDHGTVNDIAVFAKTQSLNKYTPIDLYDFVKTEFEKLITLTSNPFAISSFKENVWNKFWLPSKSFSTSAERQKFEDLFDPIFTSTFLFTIKNIIETKYSDFSFDFDVYEFMIDEIIKISLLKDIPNIAGQTAQAKYENILFFYNSQNILLESQIQSLNSVIPIISNSTQSGQPRNFSWIENIGYNMIEYVEIKFNDQVVERHNGELLYMFHELLTPLKCKNNLQEMFGNISSLTTFNKEKKEKKILFIPLSFWFNNFFEHSLPLCSLIHTRILVNVKFRNLKDICFVDALSQFVKMPKIDVSLLIENVFLNKINKYIVVNKKIHDYLFPKWVYHGDVAFTKNDLSFDEAAGFSNDRVFEIKINFIENVKEIFFALQPVDNIEKKKYNNYLENEENTIDQIKIEFSGKEKETYKHRNFYSIVNANNFYKKYFPGLMTYSFSIDPKIIQPSGSVNLKKIKSASIFIRPSSFVIENLENDKKYRFIMYGSVYEIFRVYGGHGAII